MTLPHVTFHLLLPGPVFPLTFTFISCLSSHVKLVQTLVIFTLKLLRFCRQPFCRIKFVFWTQKIGYLHSLLVF